MKVIKNYRLWLIISVLVSATLIALCIYFSGLYTELEVYRSEEKNISDQKQVINTLTDENTRLKSEKLSARSSDEIPQIITAFTNGFYNDNGKSSENERVLKIRKYVTDEMYSKMYSKNETEIIPPEESITQNIRIINSLYKIINTANATAFIEMEINHTFTNGDKDSQNVILQMELEYSEESGVWLISDLRSSKIKLEQVWR